MVSQRKSMRGPEVGTGERQAKTADSFDFFLPAQMLHRRLLLLLWKNRNSRRLVRHSIELRREVQENRERVDCTGQLKKEEPRDLLAAQ